MVFKVIDWNNQCRTSKIQKFIVKFAKNMTQHFYDLMFMMFISSCSCLSVKLAMIVDRKVLKSDLQTKWFEMALNLQLNNLKNKFKDEINEMSSSLKLTNIWKTKKTKNYLIISSLNRFTDWLHTLSSTIWIKETGELNASVSKFKSLLKTSFE